MSKFFFFILMLVMIFLSGTHSAYAQNGTPACPSSPCIYVDPNYNGTEDGTQDHPYNNPAEGNGGYVIIRNQDGTWSISYVRPATSGGTGGGPDFPIASSSDTPMVASPTVTPGPSGVVVPGRNLMIYSAIV
jgi:hypothetical protein